MTTTILRLIKKHHRYITLSYITLIEGLNRSSFKEIRRTEPACELQKPQQDFVLSSSAKLEVHSEVSFDVSDCCFYLCYLFVCVCVCWCMSVFVCVGMYGHETILYKKTVFQLHQMENCLDLIEPVFTKKKRAQGRKKPSL